MKTKATRAIVGAVVATSLMANAVMAEQAGAGEMRQKFKGPVKVFILAGQSNMEGHGGVKTLDRLGEHPTHGYLLKKIKKDDGSFAVRDDVFVSYQKADEKIKRPLSVGMGAWGADWFGPELMFGIEMGDYFKEPVLLIKTAWGGQSLAVDFRPPSAGEVPLAKYPEKQREKLAANVRSAQVIGKLPRLGNYGYGITDVQIEALRGEAGVI